MSDSPVPGSELQVPDDLSGITAQQYRAAMRHYPAGVTIVTLNSKNGPVGFTATSFASLSAQPPLISFNIAHTSSSIEALRHADSVVVHFLGEHQKHLAQRFSRTAEERFTDRSLWNTLESGEPILHGTPIWVRATIYQRIELGDHDLIIGLVTRVYDQTQDTPAAGPLVYYNGAYHRAEIAD
ncbi:flavin reductase family protein [Nocardia inohanensis]|uniref:flavin reductase family protein n=1 Tax=Nocardia inohanensis TaxID=209246 RepID=UPI00083683A2|nr:flavin reductase family protein [Nocardia inohanensis]